MFLEDRGRGARLSALSQHTCLAAIGLSDVNQSTFGKQPWFGSSVSPSLSSAFSIKNQ